MGIHSDYRDVGFMLYIKDWEYLEAAGKDWKSKHFLDPFWLRKPEQKYYFVDGRANIQYITLIFEKVCYSDIFPEIQLFKELIKHMPHTLITIGDDIRDIEDEYATDGDDNFWRLTVDSKICLKQRIG